MRDGRRVVRDLARGDTGPEWGSALRADLREINSMSLLCEYRTSLARWAEAVGPVKGARRSTTTPLGKTEVPGVSGQGSNRVFTGRDGESSDGEQES